MLDMVAHRIYPEYYTTSTSCETFLDPFKPNEPTHLYQFDESSTVFQILGLLRGIFHD